MKYIIFKANRSRRSSRSVRKMSASLAARGSDLSPSGHKFGRAFAETSDVDVVPISEPLFLEGSQALLQELNDVGPGIKYEDKSENC